MHLPVPRGSPVVVSLIEIPSNESRMDTTLLISQYRLGQSTLPPWIHTSPLHLLRPTLLHRHSVLADLETIRLILLHSGASLGRPCLRLIHLWVSVPEMLLTRHLLAFDGLAMPTLILNKGSVSGLVFLILGLFERRLWIATISTHQFLPNLHGLRRIPYIPHH